jgi:hypothetical protein
MGMTYYPALTGGAVMALTTIKQQLEMDGGYLEREDCPYEEHTKADLKALLSPQIVEVPKIEYVEKIIERKVEVAATAAEGGGQRGPKLKGSSVESGEVIGKEIAQTLDDLRQLKLNARTLQPKDKIDIMKVQATLLEKLTMLEERNINIKRLSLFMSTVMGILDDLMPEDMRQIFIKRLQPFADAE